MSSPNIDEKNKEAIEKEMKSLASVYLPSWNPDKEDAGWALVQSFAKMTEDVIKKLNEVPDKLFIAYLKNLNITLNPPLSARVPITVEPAQGTKTNKTIPANTQVADENKVLFETEKTITMTPAKLTALYGVEPSDRLYNYYKKETEQKHYLYIGSDSLFNLYGSNGKKLYVKLTVPLIENSTWYYFEKLDENGEEKWEPFYSDEQESDKKNITLYKHDNTPTSKRIINGKNLYWIRAQIDEVKTPIRLDGFEINYTSKSGIDALFYNNQPLNLEDIAHDEKTIYPFGHEPKMYDTFYIASNEAFSKRGLKVTLNFVFDVQKDSEFDSANFSKEYWDGKSWKALNITESNNNQLVFDCPRDIAKTEVNGDLNYWIRIRLMKNIYGSYSIQKGKLIAPFTPLQINNISIAVDGNISSDNLLLMSFNNLEFKEIDDSSQAIFYPVKETNTTLYLGFDKPFGEGLISLFLSIKSDAEDVKRNLEWSYSAQEQEWQTLRVNDGTNGLSQSGTCAFIAPLDQEKVLKFNQLLYWIQIEIIHLDETTSTFPLEIENVYINSVWAQQVETIKSELIGSSNGFAHQTFTLLRPPVKALEVWIKEPFKPESNVVLFEEDKEEGFWVQWMPIANLDGANALDRLYTLDSVTGEIGFGDNTYGHIPPIGKNNIKATYKTGGGTQGNIAVGKIKELVSSIPYVDKVTNIKEASGGSDTQTIYNLIEQAPKVLKTRDRAVMMEDYEILAQKASSDIAKVKAFQSMDGNNNHIKIAIVPLSQKKQPYCAQALLRYISAYLQKRAPMIVTTTAINPSYVVIDTQVTVVIKKKNWELYGAIKEQIQKKISSFLHPIYGGYTQKGWEFGVLPCYSDFFPILNEIEGIGYVQELTIAITHNDTTIDLEAFSIEPNMLVCSGTTGVKIVAQGEENAS